MTNENQTYSAPNEPIFVPEEDRAVDEDKTFISAGNKSELLDQRVNTIQPKISLKK